MQMTLRDWRGGDAIWKSRRPRSDRQQRSRGPVVQSAIVDCHCLVIRQLMAGTGDRSSTVSPEVGAAQREASSTFFKGNKPPTPVPVSASASQEGHKRPRKRRARDTWSYARPRKEKEPFRNRFNQKYWYCKSEGCSFKGTTTIQQAREHLQKDHSILAYDGPSSSSSRTRSSLDSVFARQVERQSNARCARESTVLETSLNRRLVQQALVRLIVRRSLPLNITEWPEFHAFCHSLNPAASTALYRSHNSVSRQITRSFQHHRDEVYSILSRARSCIHLCTDTWTSPSGHHKEFQAINAHFIDEHGHQRKALIALPELPKGHAGSECAIRLCSTAQMYDFESRLGSVTSDNATAMDSMAKSLEGLLANKGIHWPAATNRLRCLGHVLNLAVQAFLFARDPEAVEYASQLSDQTQQPLDEALGALSQSAANGWSTTLPLQKLREFTVCLRNMKRYNEFKALAGRVITMPNETRWSSWTTMIEDALSLRAKVNEFISEREDLFHLEFHRDEWRMLEDTYQFLQPFKEACKACEGDTVTLDCMITTLDILIAHFKASQKRHANNAALLSSITTSWYALDKYYKLTDDSPIYTAALLLHPSYRKQYLTSTWPKAWVKPAVQRVKELWKEKYALIKVDNGAQTPVTSQAPISFFQQQQELLQRRHHLNDEFEVFIEQSSIAVVNAITWWLEETQQRTFPRLSKMAIDILSAPSMSAESERVFSLTRRTISWDRTRLNCSTVEQLECQKSWIKSGLIMDYFESESEDERETEGTSEASLTSLRTSIESPHV